MNSPFQNRGARILPLACMLAALAGCFLDSEKVSRGSVVENEIAGIILSEGGSGVAGARVQLYPSDSGYPSGKANPAEAITDESGRFRITGLAEGTYTLLGRFDTLLAFRDQIRLAAGAGGGKTAVELPPDTLKAGGAIEAMVVLKPGDDPASVSGVVLGTPFSAHGSATGDLSMGGMPAGALRIRITSSLPGYKPLVVTVKVQPGGTTRIDSLALPF